PDQPRDLHGRWSGGNAGGTRRQGRIEDDARPGFVHFEDWDSLSTRARRNLRRIAVEYHRTTDADMIGPSGARTLREQAQATFTNLQNRTNLETRYHNATAYNEILGAYNDTSVPGASREEVVDAMTHVIEDQVSRGVYISDHLTGN